LRSGRLKYAVPVRHVQHSADKAALSVITRGDHVGFDPLPPEIAVRILTREPEPGYDFYGSHSEDAVRAIAAGGCWKLTLSRDPNAAINALVEAFSGNGSGQRSK
jgi:hypothetical protein